MKYVLTADKIITAKDLKKLLKDVKKDKETAIQSKSKEGHTNINDYFLFSLCANTGLRISELVALKWSDILDDSLIVRSGKGKKKRTVLFGSKTKKLFDEFKKVQIEIMDRTCEVKNHIFIGQRGPLTRHGSHYRFKHWVKKSVLSNQGLSFHSLRHAYATKCLDNGVDLNTLKNQLGHSSLVVTSCYLHLTQKSKDDVARLF